jgi:hypothetical protein
MAADFTLANNVGQANTPASIFMGQSRVFWLSRLPFVLYQNIR